MNSRILLIALLFFSFEGFSQYKIASSSVSGKKTVLVTKYDKGYVITSDNKRLEGLIQLKIINGDTTEVRYKNASKEKTKFKREQVKSYGLITLLKDARIAKIKEKNFNPGFIITNEGNKKKGKIALRFSLNSGETIGRKWFVYKVLFSEGGDDYTTYTAKDLKTVMQNIDNTENIYERYEDGFTRLINKGVIELYQNPYSTSENDFASGLVKQVQQDVAEEVAKATLKNAVKTGKGDLQNVKDNYTAVNSADISVSRKEYLVREVGKETFIILSKDNYNEWSRQLFTGCNAFKQLEDKEQKKIIKWKNLIEGVSFFNKKCN